MSTETIIDGLMTGDDPGVPSLNDFACAELEQTASPRARAIAVGLAALVLSYHAQNSVAQEVITGSTNDGWMYVSWEYDLARGTGWVYVYSNGVPLGSDGRLYFGGLIPEDAENVQDAWGNADVALNLCSGSVSPSIFLTAMLPFGPMQITFDIPNPSEMVPARSRLDYGVVCAAPSTDHCASGVGAACVMTPFGALKDFVTIRPIEENCVVADFNCDGDVDLQDFAGFQDLFTGPIDGGPK